MYRIIYLFLLISISNLCSAHPISFEEAHAKASAFFQKRGKEIASNTPVLKKQHNQTFRPYYIFNATNNEGFVIISGDDNDGDILGYGNNGTFDENEMPEDVRFWMNNYSPGTQRKKAKGDPKKPDTQHEAIEPLINTMWSQGKATEEGSPYNMLCPIVEGKHCIAGCVAVSMAQVMNYYKWPEEPCSSIPSYISNETVGQLDALPQLDFDWENMNSYYDGTENNQEQIAVAQLMRYCGQAAATSYGLDKSLAYGRYATQALRQYFGYSPKIRLIKASGLSMEKWEQIIYHEISSSRPVIYFGSTSTNTHCFICDGYDDNGFFHINWGWDGRFDGYFSLSLLNPHERMTDDGQPDGYTIDVNAIIGIAKNISSLDNISFTDPRVKAICIERWDANGDNELNHREAEAVLSIDDAFRGDSIITDFEELKYFTNLSSITPEAFAGCTHLANVKLPEQISIINDRAFEGCSALKSILIPSNVEFISNNAFIGCTSLNQIRVKYENMTYDSRQDCNAIIETISNTLLLGCHTTIIPEEVTAIGQSAFEGCIQLLAITLPQGIVTLGDRCFYGCSLLQEISLPQSVTSIGSESFAQCVGMNTIYSYNIEPPTAGFGAFDGIDATLFVPMGSKIAYQYKEEWNKLHIEEMQSENVLECENITIKRDKTGILEICMSNQNKVIGIQMRLTLPEGLSIRQENGIYDINLAEQATEYTLHCTKQSDNTYIIMVLSMVPIERYEGKLLSINIEADENIATGTYEVLFSDITISIIHQEVITSIYPSNFTSNVTIKDYDLGDPNHDGYINVTDVMMIVNYILGNHYPNFHNKEADLDHSGQIDVTDVLRVVQIILDQEIIH